MASPIDIFLTETQDIPCISPELPFYPPPRDPIPEDQRLKVLVECTSYRLSRGMIPYREGVVHCVIMIVSDGFLITSRERIKIEVQDTAPELIIKIPGA